MESLVKDLANLTRTTLRDAKAVFEIAPKAAFAYIPHSFMGQGRVVVLKYDNVDPSKPAIFFDHGYGGNTQTQPILEYLAVHGYEVFIHQKPFMMDIEKQAELSARQLTKVGRSLDDVILLGHSMGGLTQETLVKRCGVKPKKYISLATPHLGAPLALIGPGKSARQMEPLSSFCMSLWNVPFPASVESYAFTTTYDNIVPAESSFLNSGSTNILFGKANHISIIEDPQVAIWIERVITNPKEHFAPYVETRPFKSSLQRRIQTHAIAKTLANGFGATKLYEEFDRHNMFKILSRSGYEEKGSGI